MTPALLEGFRARVLEKSKLPLLQISDKIDCVKGIVLFGEGKRGRKCIHKHYKAFADCIRIQVQIDVVGENTQCKQTSFGEHLQLQARTIWSYAWVRSPVKNVDSAFDANVRCWKLEAYLAGAYEHSTPMTVWQLQANEGYRIYESDTGRSRRG